MIWNGEVYETSEYGKRRVSEMERIKARQLAYREAVENTVARFYVNLSER